MQVLLAVRETSLPRPQVLLRLPHLAPFHVEEVVAEVHRHYRRALTRHWHWGREAATCWEEAPR